MINIKQIFFQILFNRNGDQTYCDKLLNIIWDLYLLIKIAKRKPLLEYIKLTFQEMKDRKPKSGHSNKALEARLGEFADGGIEDSTTLRT